MQSPSASSGDFMAKYSEFFGLTEAAKQEQLVLQNLTSCRTPLVSTHLYSTSTTTTRATPGKCRSSCIRASPT
jgi:hypothetical protein